MSPQKQNALLYAAYPTERKGTLREYKRRWLHSLQFPPAAHLAIVSPTAPRQAKVKPQPDLGLAGEFARLTEQEVDSYISELIQTQRQDPRVAQVAVQWLEKKQAITSSSNETDAYTIQKELLNKAKEAMFR